MKQEGELMAGDHVQLVGLDGWFEIVGTEDHLVRLETDQGKQFMAGRQCVTRTRRREGYGETRAEGGIYD